MKAAIGFLLGIFTCIGMFWTWDSGTPYLLSVFCTALGMMLGVLIMAPDERNKL
jgi:hypothetical protein